MARWALRAITALALLGAPAAAAVVAVQLAPPQHIEVAGQDVRVRPVLGRNFSRIAGDAITRPEHGRIDLGVGGIDVGIDVDLDWNRLVPRDKQTRQYLGELFDDPRPAAAKIRSAARRHLVAWSLVGALSAALLEAAGWLLIRHRRRRLTTMDPAVARTVIAHNAVPRRLFAVGVAGSLLTMYVSAGNDLLRQDKQAIVGSPALDGTALAGTRVNGLVGEIIPFLSLLRPHNPFYDKVSHNLDLALGDVDVRGGADDVLFVEAEDLEDVNGMARVIGRAAKLLDADFITYSGDLTFAGKPLESYLIDTINYYSDGVPVEFAAGLHDTPEILQAAKSRGWSLADDRTHEVAGVSMLTLADPRISTIGNLGTGTVLRDADVGVRDFLADAMQEACDARPDIIVLHDHLLGERIAERGCQQVVLIDGRSFQRRGARRHLLADGRYSLEYTVGSSGGHVDTRPNTGRIQHPATFEAFSLDPVSKRLQVTVITVRADASVTVSPPEVLVVGTGGAGPS